MFSRLPRIPVFAAALTLAVLVASCAPAAAPAASPAAAAAKPGGPLTKLDFMMPFIPPTEYSYFAMAQEKGFYAAEGLEINLQEGTGSGNTVKVVGAGTTLMGLADASQILPGRVQG